MMTKLEQERQAAITELQTERARLEQRIETIERALHRADVNAEALEALRLRRLLNGEYAELGRVMNCITWCQG